MIPISYYYHTIAYQYHTNAMLFQLTKFMMGSLMLSGLVACGGGEGGGGTMPRYDYPLAIDSNFAISGYAIQSTGVPVTTHLTSFAVSDFIVDAQGRIVVTGTRTTGTREAWVYRMNADGTPDTTCGTNGWSAFTTGGPATPQRIRELPDGRYVLGGYIASPSIWAIRSTDCAVDATFGMAGKASFPSPSPTELQDGVIAMEVDATGRIVASVAATLSGKLTVARFLSTGAVDPTFGTGGLSQTSTTDGATPKPWALALRSDGTVLVGVSSFSVQ